MMNRKLDAAIAEALGNQVEWVGGEPKMRYKLNGAWWINYVLDYSSCGNAMLELDREMQARGFMLMVEVYNEGYSAAYWICHAEEWTGDYVSDNMPKAVALAAYKALTEEGWRE
jgi:hypothetical protein